MNACGRLSFTEATSSGGVCCDIELNESAGGLVVFARNGQVLFFFCAVCGALDYCAALYFVGPCWTVATVVVLMIGSTAAAAGVGRVCSLWRHHAALQPPSA